MSSRILVINDDQSILDLFDLILKGEGYEVILSRVNYEDVKDIEQLRPDLILLDFKIGNDNIGWLLLQNMCRPLTLYANRTLCAKPVTPDQQFGRVYV
jgi:DNA-binding response OmpR family regulator